MKFIAHVDADSFYVSCERVRSPELLARPVCVLGNQGAIIIARSYEAKKVGAQVGMPVWEAKKLYPDLIFIKRDFEWYAVLSEAMQEVFYEFTDTVEYYSIDESFLDLGDFMGDFDYLAAEIQNAVFKKTGLPVSVGISLTKTLAKMASDKNKPLGQKVVLKDGLVSFLKDCSVSEVSGIGAKLFNRLAPLGINTAFDFVSKERQFIKNILHKPGEMLWYELNGVSIMPVRNERPERKGISRGGSLYGMKTDKNIVFAFCLRNLERLFESLIKQKLEIKKIKLFLICEDGYFQKIESQFLDYTNSFLIMLEELKKMFFKIFSPSLKYKSLHIFAEDLRNFSFKQLNLFDFSSEKSRKINFVKEKVLKKFGVFSLRPANTAYISEVFRDDASNFEISDMDKKFCF